MKFYLAGNWNDRENLGKKIDYLSSIGYQVTHNWTEFELPGVTGQGNGGSAPPNECAVRDIQAILDAEFVIAIMDDPSYAYRGTFTEVGAALATNTPVYIVCPFDLMKRKEYCLTNCFFYHPGIKHFASWKDFLDFMNGDNSKVVNVENVKSL